MALPYFDDIAGCVIEKLVDILEFVCPPLREYLSWDFADDGTMFAIFDEDDDAFHSKPRSEQGIQTPLFNEKGTFVHRAASAA